MSELRSFPSSYLLSIHTCRRTGYVYILQTATCKAANNPFPASHTDDYLDSTTRGHVNTCEKLVKGIDIIHEAVNSIETRNRAAFEQLKDNRRRFKDVLESLRIANTTIFSITRYMQEMESKAKEVILDADVLRRALKAVSCIMIASLRCSNIS